MNDVCLQYPSLCWGCQLCRFGAEEGDQRPRAGRGWFLIKLQQPLFLSHPFSLCSSKLV